MAQFPLTTAHGMTFNSEQELDCFIREQEQHLARRNAALSKFNASERRDEQAPHNSGNGLRLPEQEMARYPEYPINHLSDVPQAQKFYQRQWEQNAALQDKYPHVQVYVAWRVSKQVAAVNAGRKR